MPPSSDPPQIRRLKRDLARRPRDRHLRTQLADAYYSHGRILDALKAYDRLVEMHAATPHVWCRIGTGLSAIGEFAQAIGAFESALQADPDHAEARHNLARALYKLGDADRAFRLLWEVAERDDDIQAWAGLATISPGCPAASQRQVLLARQRYAAALRTVEHAPAVGRHATRPRRDRAISLGYVSAHFADANYMKPVWPVINGHDRNRFQVHLFHDGDPAERFDWLRHAANDHLHPIAELDNRAAAQCIRTAKIDVLIDLSAYSQPQRLGLYLHRPAPVQAAWFNMYATSGIDAFDYIIGDRHVVDRHEQPYYCERIVRLPVSYLTFQTNHPAPPVAPAPCVASKRFTFGSLATQYKITPPVLDAWARILQGASESRLRLANRELASQENRHYLLEQFQRRGVDRQRIEIAGPADHYSFLQLYDGIDLALDPFPYNGGTTTMEAIWQGVPVLTFRGDRWASRTSASILRHTHLAGFAVGTSSSTCRPPSVGPPTRAQPRDCKHCEKRCARGSSAAVPATPIV